MKHEAILPPRMYKSFAATLKLTFTRDGGNGAKAIVTRKWAGLNPDKLRYEMLFTGDNQIMHDQSKETRKFIETKDWAKPC